METAAWAAIVAVPIGLASVAAPFLVIVVGEQRDLRKRLREILLPLAKACSDYHSGDHYVLAAQFVHDTTEGLRKLAKQDGLRTPNPETLGQLVDTLNDIPPRFDMDQQLSFLPAAERKELLKNNASLLDARVLQAGAQAAVLVNATHAIDRFNYRVYRRLKWHGRDDWTGFTLPGPGKGRE